MLILTDSMPTAGVPKGTGCSGNQSKLDTQAVKCGVSKDHTLTDGMPILMTMLSLVKVER